MNTRHPWLKVGAILLIGAGLRLWHFDYRDAVIGRPDGGDGATKIRTAMNVEKGFLAPYHYRQPAYLVYVSGALYKVVDAFGRIDLDKRWRLTERLIIFHSVLAILVTYLLARQVFDHEGTALLAALLMSVIPVEVIGSHYIKEDVPLMLFSNLAILAMVSFIKTRRAAMCRIAGYVVGLAASVKYAGFILLLPYALVYAHCLRFAPRGTQERKALDSAFLWGLMAAILVFLALNPYFLYDPYPAWHGLGFQVGYSNTAHNDGTALTFWEGWGVFGLRMAVLPGLTWPVAAAALLGMVFMWAKDRAPARLFLFLWVAIAYLGPEHVPAKLHPFFARYLHWLFPGLCVFAAWGLYSLRRRCPAGSPARWLANGAIALCVAVPLMHTILIISGTRHDTRRQAIEWMAKHLPPDTVIYTVEPHAIRGEMRGINLRHGPAISVEHMRREGVKYVAMSSFCYDRYVLMGPHSLPRAREAQDAYFSILGACDLVKEFRPALSIQTFGFHNPVVRIYKIGNDPQRH